MTELHLNASRIAGDDACRKILLVGELNPFGADPNYALYHQPHRAAGWHLQHRIFGIEARRWYLPMWRVNLCTNGAWDGRDAVRKAAALIEPDDVPWNLVVMLGVKVAGAFKYAGGGKPEPFEHAIAARTGGKVLAYVALPHPSGRNARTWDGAAGPANIARARNVMRQMAPLVPWGELAGEPGSP